MHAHAARRLRQAPINGRETATTETAERADLQPLVEPILPPAARKAVYRRDDRHPEALQATEVQHVRPVAVTVDDIWTQSHTQVGNGRALPRIAPGRDHNRVRADPRFGQRCEERLEVFRCRSHGDDGHVVAVAVQALAKHLDHALKSAEFRAGRDQMDNHHLSLATVSAV